MLINQTLITLERISKCNQHFTVATRFAIHPLNTAQVAWCVEGYRRHSGVMEYAAVAFKRLVQVFFLFDTDGKYHFDVVIALAKIKIILVDSRAVRRNKYLHHVVHYFIA